MSEERCTKEGLLAYFEQFLDGKCGMASAEVLADLMMIMQQDTEKRAFLAGLSIGSRNPGIHERADETYWMWRLPPATRASDSKEGNE